VQDIKAYGGIELQFLSLFILVLDRVEWSDSPAGCFIAGKDPRGLREGMEALKKRKAFHSCREAKQNSSVSYPIVRSVYRLRSPGPDINGGMLA
jgi:hypothetical protein